MPHQPLAEEQNSKRSRQIPTAGAYRGVRGDQRRLVDKGARLESGRGEGAYGEGEAGIEEQEHPFISEKGFCGGKEAGEGCF